MGKYINQNEIDNIMYGLTVQDLVRIKKKYYNGSGVQFIIRL